MRIETLGVITKNRPGSVADTLPGYVENGLRFGRKLDVVVVDDSTDPAAVAANRATLTRLNRRYGSSVAYAGLTEKDRFARALADEGIRPEVARFALFGWGDSWPTFGAGRNALLLHTMGRAIFCPDDDVHCRLAAAPPRRGRRPAAEPNAEEYWFFHDHAEALNAVRFEDEDLLAHHERFLGRELDGRKAWATLNGIVGDCALSARNCYNWLKGDSRGRLLDCGEDGGKVLSRQILRVARDGVAGPATDFTSIAFALDNRAFLPPFMPAHGGEDRMYAATASKCLVGGCVVHVPRALLHAPPEPRRYSPEDLWEVSTTFDRVNDFIIRCCLLPFIPPSDDPEANLRALGREMLEFSGLPPRDFRDRAEKAIRRAFCVEALFLEKLLKGAAWTGFWGRSRERYVANLTAFIDSGADLLPRCLGADSDRAWSSWQSLVGDFGRLAREWPDMLRAVERLRRSGRQFDRI